MDGRAFFSSRFLLFLFLCVFFSFLFFLVFALFLSLLSKQAMGDI